MRQAGEISEPNLVELTDRTETLETYGATRLKALLALSTLRAVPSAKAWRLSGNTGNRLGTPFPSAGEMMVPWYSAGRKLGEKVALPL